MKLSAAIVISVSSLSLFSCSSGVTVRATRLVGIVIDTTIIVDVGEISEAGTGTFKEELLQAIRSRDEFGAPSADTLETPFAYLVIEGTYRKSSSDHTEEEKEGEETVRYRVTTYVAAFDYSVIDNMTGELVTEGEIREQRTERDKESGGSIGESIINAIVGGIVKAIIFGDPHSSLKSNIIRRFVGELSPHELQVEVVLFEDSDMPELRKGIVFARLGKWKDAADAFLTAIDTHPGHKNLHKAYYNAGVAFEYDHQYSFALEYLDKAFQMEPSEEYAGEIQRCERYQREYNWREGYLERLKLMRN
ncbi:MAG: tetratricopeptide repeat protein [Ignavibacteriales bacterium]|nr:tetratricopeptide repeat protein [Ignavibacteriales bacterium]